MWQPTQTNETLFLSKCKLQQAKLTDASPNVFARVSEYHSFKLLCPAQTKGWKWSLLNWNWYVSCNFISTGNVQASSFNSMWAVCEVSQLSSISRRQAFKAKHHNIDFNTSYTRSNNLAKLFIWKKPFPMSNRRQEDTSPSLFLQTVASRTYIYESAQVSFYNKV